MNQQIDKVIIDQKLQKMQEKLLEKVAKFGYQEQYDKLISQGFGDSKSILKGLKKTNGDIEQAITLIKELELKYQEKQNKKDHHHELKHQLKFSQFMANKKEAIKQNKQQSENYDLQNKVISQTENQENDITQQSKNEPIEEKKWKKYLKKRENTDDGNVKDVKTFEKKERKHSRKRENTDEADNDKECHQKLKWKDIKNKDNLDDDEKQFFQNRIQKKFERYNQKIPLFQEFHNNMTTKGFKDISLNFRALKKFDGDENQAKTHVEQKIILQNLLLETQFDPTQLKKIYIDCNNCFYLDKQLIRKAINGKFQEIEEKISTLVKFFQFKLDFKHEFVLVFDDSKLMEDEQSANIFIKEDFRFVNAKPTFASADDALVSLANKEQDQESILYVTSDRILQARLIQQNAKKIMGSKSFFKAIEQLIGRRQYAAIIQV